MPFRSEKQRRFLWAKHPDIAKRWAHNYPDSNKGLPMYAHDSDAKSPDDEKPVSKTAALAALKSLLVNNLNTAPKSIFTSECDKIVKKSNSKMEQIVMPQDEQPTFAGEKEIHSILKPEAEDEGSIGDARNDKGTEIPVNNCENPLLSKLAVVLAPHIQQEIENRRAQEEARNANRMPQNVNMKQYAVQTPTIPPPMGMTAPPAPQQAQAQPQQPQSGQLAAVGGGNSPNANPINSFGGLSSNGDINGNAAFGTQNGMGGEKLAYGYSDDYTDYDRYLAGGATWGMKKDDAVKFTQLARDLAAKNKINLRFSPERYEVGYDPDEAIKHLTESFHLKDDDSGTLTKLPYFYTAETQQPGLFRRMFGAKREQLTDANHPITLAWKQMQQKQTKAAAQKCSCGCGDTPATCKCPPSCSCRQKGGSCYGLKLEKKAGSPAWQRSEGKNDEGGLNAKGRASYNNATGGNLKAPVTESNPKGDRAKRQNSFCSRMCGMKRVNTGAGTAKDPDSRINKSLRKWNCKCSAAMSFGEKCAIEVIQPFGKHKKQVSFPKQIQNSTVDKAEAEAIARAMAASAPHGALDNTRVDLYGTRVKDLQDRMVENNRLSPLQRYLYRYDHVEGLPDKTQLLPDAYHPHADTVWLPSGNPGVMMHELGHSIDFNGYPNTTPRMLLAGIYSRTAPTLWKEHAAWRKGQQHFLSGAAEHKLPPDLVVKTLRDASRAKRMGLGSYWGAGLGGAAGLGGGLALLANNPGMDPRVAAATMAIGGGLGGLGGLTLGNYMGEHEHFDSPEAAQNYLNKYTQAYAKKHKLSPDAAAAEIQTLAQKLIAKKKKKAPAKRQLAKAASAASLYKTACGV